MTIWDSISLQEIIMVIIVLSSLIYKMVLLDYILVVIMYTIIFISGVLLLYLVSLMLTGRSWKVVSINNTAQSAGIWLFMGLCCLLSPLTDYSTKSQTSDLINETIGIVIYSLNSIFLLGGLIIISMGIFLSSNINGTYKHDNVILNTRR